MQILSYFKNHKLTLLLALIIIIIVVSAGVIFLIDSKSNPSTSTLGTNLKGYSSLVAKINSLNSKSEMVNFGNYTRLVRDFSALENKSLSEQNKYDNLLKSAEDAMFLYTDTHNPKVRDVFNDIKAFAKENFSKYYKENSFIIYCQDPSCQDSTQPQGVINIIDEIKASNVHNFEKQQQVDNLTNVGYVSKKNENTIVESYLQISYTIRNDGAFTEAGLNEKIADEIYYFVLKTYPETFKKLYPDGVSLKFRPKDSQN